MPPITSVSALLAMRKSIFRERNTVKPVLSDHSKKDQKLVFKNDYRLMQVKSITGEHSAIFSTFIKLPFVINIFVLSIFEWPLKTGFTVHYFGEIITCDP